MVEFRLLAGNWRLLTFRALGRHRFGERGHPNRLVRRGGRTGSEDVGSRTERRPRSGRDNVGPRRRRSVRRGARPPNSVGLRQSRCAAGCFVGVGARSKIPVQSVDGAPRDQDAQDERGRSRCHDLPPAGPIHLHASLELVLQPRRASRHRFSHPREYPIVIIGCVGRGGSRCSRLVASSATPPSASKFRL